MISCLKGSRHNGSPSPRRRLTWPGRASAGLLVFRVFAALAEFVRELIAEGTWEGRDGASACGARSGQPP